MEGKDSGAEARAGVGLPDGLDRIWAPHRLAYIQGENKPSTEESDTCPFCRIPTLDDKEGLMVHRGETVFAVLNLYPYSPGHLMLCPYRHVADYTDLADGEIAEIALFTQDAMRTIRTTSGAHGFNIGLNQGNVAGAGISAHLHQHVVPRWGGDANFMPVVARTRVLPQLLQQTRELLAAAWPGHDD
jgi:ATP adenylyltransferase